MPLKDFCQPRLQIQHDPVDIALRRGGATLSLHDAALIAIDQGNRHTDLDTGERVAVGRIVCHDGRRFHVGNRFDAGSPDGPPRGFEAGQGGGHFRTLGQYLLERRVPRDLQRRRIETAFQSAQCQVGNAGDGRQATPGLQQLSLRVLPHDPRAIGFHACAERIRFTDFFTLEQGLGRLHGLFADPDQVGGQFLPLLSNQHIVVGSAHVGQDAQSFGLQFLLRPLDLPGGDLAVQTQLVRRSRTAARQSHPACRRNHRHRPLPPRNPARDWGQPGLHPVSMGRLNLRGGAR